MILKFNISLLRYSDYFAYFKLPMKFHKRSYLVFGHCTIPNFCSLHPGKSP